MASSAILLSGFHPPFMRVTGITFTMVCAALHVDLSSRSLLLLFLTAVNIMVPEKLDFYILLLPSGMQKTLMFPLI